MASQHHTELESIFATYLDPVWLDTQAKALGVFKRWRKLTPLSLVSVLIFGFAHGAQRSIAGLCRALDARCGIKLSRSSLYDRFNDDLVAFLEAIFKRLAIEANKLSETRKTSPTLSFLASMTCMDATVISLHPALAHLYPACRTNHTLAALKVHAVYNVLDATVKKVYVTCERTSDKTPIQKLGRFVKGKLLIFDLGYYKFQLFLKIERLGGKYISRAKSNINVKVLADNCPAERGRKIEMEGLGVQQVLKRSKRKILDLEVALGRKGGKARLIALRHKDKWHLYLTNLDIKEVKASQVGQLYKRRWSVELLFKSVKSLGRGQQLASQNKAVVLSLVWSTMLMSLLRSLVMYHVRRAVSVKQLPMLRFSRLWFERAGDLLRIAMGRAAEELSQQVWDYFLTWAPDPNHRTRFDTVLAAAPL